MNAPLIQTFMTHRMTDAAITLLASGREDETKRVMDAVERSLAAVPGALQHVVIYGPRGFGKSFMARLAQIETGKLVAARNLAIPFVLLPEEQHNLTRNPHALPAYITHRLADLRTGEDHSWTGAMFQWPDPAQEVRQWDAAIAELESELDRSLPDGKGLAIVVIENFDNLLFSVFKESTAEQRLRKWLDRRGNRVMLIATATGSVDMDYDRPLFQAFQSIRLSPWEQDTCIEYFNRRRASEGKPPLDPAQEAKARAIADFIGGNPRLAQLLSEVLETEDALSVADTMKALADKLADYYRRRIDDLPPLAQGLLDALIRGGEPASQTELAARVGAPGQSTIARVMQDLQRSDVIRGLPAPDSKETLYRITDRVFVHYYRLRQGMAMKTPLATILEFLRAFYTPEEKRLQAMNHLEAGRYAEARVFADLVREGAADETLGSDFFLGFPLRLQRILDVSGEMLHEPLEDLMPDIEASPEQVIGKVEGWALATSVLQTAVALIVTQCLARLGLHDQADSRLLQQLSMNDDPGAGLILHAERAALLSQVKQDQVSAMKEARLAKQLADTAFRPLVLGIVGERARTLYRAGRWKEALDGYQELATLAEQLGDQGIQAKALAEEARSLVQLTRYDDAVLMAHEAALKAAEVGLPDTHYAALLIAAHSHMELGRYEEALVNAQSAVALAEHSGNHSNVSAVLWLVTALLIRLERLEEGIEASVTALSMEPSALDARDASMVIAVALFLATRKPATKVLGLFPRWVAWNISNLQDGGEAPWAPLLCLFFAASASARVWEGWDQLVENPTPHMIGLILSTIPVGEAIALRGAREGRAEGYATARETLPRLIRLWDRLEVNVDERERQLADLVTGFARHSHDPGLLRDVAGLLTADLTPEAPKQAALLLALAQVDAADDAQAVLARMDPDVATWLRRLRDLPEAASKPRRHRK